MRTCRVFISQTSKSLPTSRAVGLCPCTCLLLWLEILKSPEIFAWLNRQTFQESSLLMEMCKRCSSTQMAWRKCTPRRFYSEMLFATQDGRGRKSWEFVQNFSYFEDYTRFTIIHSNSGKRRGKKEYSCGENETLCLWHEDKVFVARDALVWVLALCT